MTPRRRWGPLVGGLATGLVVAALLVALLAALDAGLPQTEAERAEPAMKTWHVGDIPYRMGHARVDVVEFEHICLYVVATADGVATTASPKTEAGCH